MTIGVAAACLFFWKGGVCRGQGGVDPPWYKGGWQGGVFQSIQPTVKMPDDAVVTLGFAAFFIVLLASGLALTINGMIELLGDHSMTIQAVIVQQTPSTVGIGAACTTTVRAAETTWNITQANNCPLNNNLIGTVVVLCGPGGAVQNAVDLDCSSSRSAALAMTVIGWVCLAPIILFILIGMLAMCCSVLRTPNDKISDAPADRV